MKTPSVFLLVTLSVAPGCAHDAVAPDSAPPPCAYASANDGTQSYDILCHDPIANQVKVKHILLGWHGLPADHPLDPRAEARSRAEAEALARDLLQRLRGGAAIEPLMDTYSEDPGSAHTGLAYDVAPGAALVSGFKSLSLRLQVHEAGIVASPLGLHIIQRIE